MAKKALKARVKLTPELWGKLESYVLKAKTPLLNTQVAVFLGISIATLYNWAEGNKELKQLLELNQTKRLDYETRQLVAGKMPPNVWKLLAEFNHKMVTGYQQQLLDLKRAEQQAQQGTQAVPPPTLQMNFEVLPPQSITVEQLQEGI